MSRIQKYKESLYRFIKEKSCLFEFETNDELNTYVYNKIKNSDLIFPILLLTIMNNQNKKNRMTMQGYYMASCVEFLTIIFYLVEFKNDVIRDVGEMNYTKMWNNVNLYANKSLQQNLESIKNTYQQMPKEFVDILLNALNTLNGTLQILYSYENSNINVSNRQCDNNIVKWYLKNNDGDLLNKFKTFKQVTTESLNIYIEKKYTSICDFSIIIGWLMGGGNVKDVPKLKKISKSFSIMYKLAKDFENLDNDIKNSTDYTTNYVLNYGLQNGYEMFLNSKQSFIEDSMVDDMYTNTIKEIVDIIEANVDLIIDQTSPDLKSNYSSNA